MTNIGITGQNGFIGTHLYNTLGLHPEKYNRIQFQREWFDEPEQLDNFVSECDVIVHLAGMNRHEDQQVIYDTNIKITSQLVESLQRTGHTPQVIFTSSLQEERENPYGKSKKESRELLADWSKRSGGQFSGMIVPNVFGPFGKPYYNSFIATFCHQLTHNEEPRIDHDGSVNLIYVGELVNEILQHIDSEKNNHHYIVTHTHSAKVSEILLLLNHYRDIYFNTGEIPELNTTFELNLFNTFRCYIDHENHYPVKFTQHTDPRGSFVEIIRLGTGGQVSFSTTVPGITRGNHYHTRKIERFAVIKGNALIQLRKMGTEKVLDFYLDGNEPAYVDMPIWYTHNIKNVGDEVLYTNFWINEPFNPDDADTYFVEV